MKQLIRVIIISILSIGVVSCSLEDEGYPIDNIWIGFGIFYKDNATSLGYKVKLDNKEEIIPIATNLNLGNFTDSCRVLVNYTILSDIADTLDYNKYYVKINMMQDILMKGIIDITPAIEDSIGNDPIIVKDAWLSGGLLNFELKYWGYNKKHFINLVKQPGEITTDSQPIELELRHNANNDLAGTLYIAYVSFDLSAIKIANTDSVKFKVTATDYNGDVYSDDGVYKYSSD